VTDQHTTHGTKIIVATKREAHYVLDGILGNAADTPISEHASDTHGVTLVNFGLFDLLGLQLSPRIRDLGKITLYRAGPESQVKSAFPLAGPLLTRRANLDPLAGHWDDLLRLAGSLKFGHATGLAAGRQALGVQPAEHARGGAQGVRRAAAHDLRRPLPVRPRLPAQDLPPAQ
jgi:TnpA family transposase